MTEIKEIKVDDIIVEDRVRKFDVEEIDSLAHSIALLGLLQPIAITPDKKLIFGARRVRAFRALRRKTIPARIIDVDDPVTLLRMEDEENECRLDFTPSEKVEIARRIEESMGNRWGGDRKSSVSNGTLEKPIGRAEEIAAKSVDMSHTSYRRAKAVVDSGNQEIVEQMDKGDLSIHAAYEQVKQEKNPKQHTFKITLYNNPLDDAKNILSKVGKEYSTQLAVELLKISGHKVEEVK